MIRRFKEFDVHSFEIRVFVSIFTFNWELQNVYLDRERAEKNIFNNFSSAIILFTKVRGVTQSWKCVQMDGMPSRDNQSFQLDGLQYFLKYGGSDRAPLLIWLPFVGLWSSSCCRYVVFNNTGLLLLYMVRFSLTTSSCSRAKKHCANDKTTPWRALKSIAFVYLCCTTNTHKCDADALCNNTDGSYNCSCKEGFHGDGKNCSSNYEICSAVNFLLVAWQSNLTSSCFRVVQNYNWSKDIFMNAMFKGATSRLVHLENLA